MIYTVNKWNRKSSCHYKTKNITIITPHIYTYLEVKYLSWAFYFWTWHNANIESHMASFAQRAAWLRCLPSSLPQPLVSFEFFFFLISYIILPFSSWQNTLSDKYSAQLIATSIWMLTRLKTGWFVSTVIIKRMPLSFWTAKSCCIHLQAAPSNIAFLYAPRNGTCLGLTNNFKWELYMCFLCAP